MDKILEFFLHNWITILTCLAGGGIITLIATRKQRSATLKKTLVDTDTSVLELEMKKDEYKAKQWNAMKEENKLLHEELDETEKRMEAMERAFKDEMALLRDKLKKAYLKIEEQTVKLNMYETINS